MAIRADIYWDSCVFIDCLQHTPGRYDVLREIVEAARRGEARIVTSAFSIAEVVGLSQGRPVSREDVQKIKDFFENEYVSLRQVDRATVELAADIGRLHSIKPPDAVHVATAIRARCRELQTYDGKMLAHDGKIHIPPMSIKVPSLPAGASSQRSLSFNGGDAKPAAPPHLGCRLPIHPLRRLVHLAELMSRVG